jgi:hypothetical protein
MILGAVDKLCLKIVTYKHLDEPRLCPKPKRHRGACWGYLKVADLPKVGGAA